LVLLHVSGLDDEPLLQTHHEVCVLISQRVSNGSSEVVGTNLTRLSCDVSEYGEGLCDLDAINLKHGKTAEGGMRLDICHLVHLYPSVLIFNVGNCEHHADRLAT
ncbi:hypothetical protein PENTCL1PPCAC_9203, partial [Pristionchus entomophagus]